MGDNIDAPNVVVHPPVALAMALVIAFAANWVYPLRFVPSDIPHLPIGLLIMFFALLLAGWAVLTFRKAKTNVLTNQAALAIVSTGPFAYSRNPIYVAVLLGLVGLALATNSLWFLVALVVMYLVLRFGVIAREEIYLAGKFGQTYLDYKGRVRRWL